MNRSKTILSTFLNTCFGENRYLLQKWISRHLGTLFFEIPDPSEYDKCASRKFFHIGDSNLPIYGHTDTHHKNRCTFARAHRMVGWIDSCHQNGIFTYFSFKISKSQNQTILSKNMEILHFEIIDIYWIVNPL